MKNTSNTWEVPASQKVFYNHVSAFMAKADATQINNGISYKSKRKLTRDYVQSLKFLLFSYDF